MNKTFVVNEPTYIVTGATGWLGKRVIAALCGRSEDPNALNINVGKIRALVHPGENVSSLKAMDVEIVEGDLRDPASLDTLMAGCMDGIVISLAGVIHPKLFTSAFDAVNYRGTLNVLNAAKKAGIRRGVFMSSNSPLGTNPHPGHLFKENSPYNPYMGYGRSKMRMEKALVERMSKSGEPEISIIRAPWFYGPGQPARQTMFFTMIRKGKFPVLGDGSQRRSMAFVDTLATGILLAASVPQAAGQIYWIADEKPYEFSEIVETVREVLRDDFAMDVSEKVASMPRVVADVARVVDGTLQSIGLYQQKIHVLSELNATIACDISKAKSELGFAPAIELREGMRRSVAWCLDNALLI